MAIDWRSIGVNFSGANQALAGAANTLSQVGDSFGRMRMQMQQNEAAKLNADLQERELAERIRQFDLSQAQKQSQFETDQEFRERQLSQKERSDLLSNRVTVAGQTGEYTPSLMSALGEPTQSRGTATNGGSTDISALTNSVSNRYSLPSNVMSALFETESGNNPNAVSSAGAQGLGQLMPGTARDLGVTDPFNPEQNAEGSAKYLRQMLNKFGNMEDALAAYNWGPGNMDKYIASGRTKDMPKETQNYVSRIMGKLNPEDLGNIPFTGIERQDLIRQQNVADTMRAERDTLLTSMQDVITSPYTTSDRREELQTRYNQLLEQGLPERPDIASTVPITSPTSVSTTSTARGTPESPLLGLQNKSQRQIDEMTARGSVPSLKLQQDAIKEQEDINKKEKVEERHQWSNTSVADMMREAGGDAILAEDMYRTSEFSRYGDNAKDSPLAGVVESQKRDKAIMQKVIDNDKDAIKTLHSKLKLDGEKFLKEDVNKGEDRKFEVPMRRVAINWIKDPNKEEATIGALSRAIFDADVGNKAGFGSDAKWEATWLLPDAAFNETLTALNDMSKHDLNTVKLQDMKPLEKRMFNYLHRYKLVDDNVYSAILERSNDRDVAVQKELDRKAEKSLLRKERNKNELELMNQFRAELSNEDKAVQRSIVNPNDRERMITDRFVQRSITNPS